jgi:hypothetical protein
MVYFLLSFSIHFISQINFHYDSKILNLFNKHIFYFLFFLISNKRYTNKKEEEEEETTTYIFFYYFNLANETKNTHTHTQKKKRN